MSDDTEKKFEIDTTPYTTAKEGKAEVQFPSTQDVFYNPVQEFNRDLSVSILRLYAAIHHKANGSTNNEKKSKRSKDVPTLGELIKEHKLLEFFSCNKENAETTETDNSVEDKSNSNDTFSLLTPEVHYPNGINILEALAASGLRSIRYAREVGGVNEIVGNDYSEKAVECMKHNIKFNKVEHLVKPSHNDASLLMYQNKEDKRFHAIDLDPYGSPHQFLDAAVQSVSNGGILLVTCTDMAVLCGNSPETCYIKYGALSLKSKACHEIGLRIVLQSIESHANRYGRYIVPLLSISVDFYVRVIVQVFTSQKKCKESFAKMARVYQCVGCETVSLERLGSVVVNGNSTKYQLATSKTPLKCEHCNFRKVCAGPIWADPIHDKEFVTLLKHSLIEEDFGTYRRLYGILTMVEEELPDVPLYYITDRLASIVSVGNIFKMRELRSALLNGGFRVSMSHAQKASFKTDAPPEFIWDIMRAWDKKFPAKREKMSPIGVAKTILDKPQTHDILFDLHPEAEADSKKQVLLRFQVNPEKYWGPKQRSKTSLFNGDQNEKRERKQGRKKRKLEQNTD